MGSMYERAERENLRLVISVEAGTSSNCSRLLFQIAMAKLWRQHRTRKREKYLASANNVPAKAMKKAKDRFKRRATFGYFSIAASLSRGSDNGGVCNISVVIYEATMYYSQQQQQRATGI